MNNNDTTPNGDAVDSNTGDLDDNIRAEIRAKIHSEQAPDNRFGALCHSIGVSVQTGRTVVFTALGVGIGAGISLVFPIGFSLREIDPFFLLAGYALFITALLVMIDLYFADPEKKVDVKLDD